MQFQLQQPWYTAMAIRVKKLKIRLVTHRPSWISILIIIASVHSFVQAPLAENPMGLNYVPDASAVLPSQDKDKQARSRMQPATEANMPVNCPLLRHQSKRSTASLSDFRSWKAQVVTNHPSWKSVCNSRDKAQLPGRAGAAELVQEPETHPATIGSDFMKEQKHQICEALQESASLTCFQQLDVTAIA